MRHPLTHQSVGIQGAAWQADLQFPLHKILRHVLLSHLLFRHARFWHMLSLHAVFRRCFSQPIFFQFSLFSSFSELLLTHDVLLLS